MSLITHLAILMGGQTSPAISVASHHNQTGVLQ